MFKIKYTNYINLLLFAAYFVVVFVTYIQKFNGSQNSAGIVTNVEKSYKYKVNHLNIKLENNEKIQVSYPNSFFDAESFLRVKPGDSLKYSVHNNKVSNIQNIQNKNELDELYFSMLQSDGFQIFIIMVLFVFNIIQMKKLRDANAIVAKNESHLKKSSFESINDFTKKYSVLTLLIIIAVLVFGYLIFNSSERTQIFLQNVYFFKYFILLFGLVIPLPFVVANYILLKKLKSYK